MTTGQEPALDDAARAVVEEEAAIFARVRTVLAKAWERAERAAPSELRSIDALRALRDEAIAASADDLPAILHEMSVRQRLIERAAAPTLPDPERPYLAHLRLREGGRSKDYLLGHATLLEPEEGVRIVDWRVAPVAQIFYRYREGDEFEESFPGRDIEGVVEARRIVVVVDGVLTQIVGDGLVLTRNDDGRWENADRGSLALQPGGAGTAARPGSLTMGGHAPQPPRGGALAASLGVGIGTAERAMAADVTALLDREQFAAVCAPAEEPLLVLGTAGSGKTTVALHRLARIAALDPEARPLAAMKVVVPEEGLARLSRRLLEPLGAGVATTMTLDAWSLELVQHVFADAKMPRLWFDAPALVSSLKRHPALYPALRDRFARMKASNATLKVIRRRLADAFTDRGFLEGVVAASKGDLSKGAIEDTVRHTMLQIADTVGKQLRSVVDPTKKRAVDDRPLAEGTPEELAGTMDVEELPIVLCARAWRAGIDAPVVAHAVLDEAEDFSLFDLFAFGKLLGEAPSVTLAGDEAQQTASSFAGWPASLAMLGVGNASVCRLAVSYRCPTPVTDLARHLLGSLAPETPARAARPGAPVGRFHFPDEGQSHLFLAGALRDLTDREPRASVAVIAHDVETARRFHALVAELPNAHLVVGGEFAFEPGIDVCVVDDAKGLEWDYVVVPDATAEAYPATVEARRRLHVAVTRTSHQLWIISGGAPSLLLEPA